MSKTSTPGGVMIDRDARSRAYAALRRFADGITTNDEFESEYPDSGRTADRSIRAIETMVWQLYSDHEVHTLAGTHVPDVVGRGLLDRCLRFLSTDREYAWPVDNFIVVRDASPLANALTLGAAGRRAERRYQEFTAGLSAAGDLSAWPFVSPDELALAAQQ